jgi:hypothetical protein
MFGDWNGPTSVRASYHAPAERPGPAGPPGPWKIPSRNPGRVPLFFVTVYTPPEY